MPKKWSDVASNSAFRALSADEQEQARLQYFDEVVAPQVGADEVEAARAEFLTSTAVATAQAPVQDRPPVVAAPGPSRPMGRGFSYKNPPIDAAVSGALSKQSILDQPAKPGQQSEAARRADLEWQSMSPRRQQEILSAKTGAERGTISATPAPGIVKRALDATVRKPLDNSLAGAAIETLGDAARGTLKASTTLGQSAWGAVRAGADAAGFDIVSDFAGNAHREGEVTRGNLTNARDQNSLTERVFESTFTSVPLALAAPGAPLMAIMAQSAANEYGQSRASGLTPEAASERAVVMGLAEGIGERFGMPQLQKLFAKAAGRATGKELSHILADMLIKEQAGEQVTQLLQSGYEAKGRFGNRPDMTLAEYLDDAVETAKVTLGQSLVTGGLAGGVRATAKRQTAATQLADAIDTGTSAFDTQAGTEAEAIRALSPNRGPAAIFTSPSTEAAGLTPLVVPGVAQTETVPPAGQTAPGATNATAPMAAPVQPGPTPLAGDAQDWQQFAPETGTLGVPRAEMPQIRAEHRGPLVNFLAARDITHEQTEMPAGDLKPTQAEFSLSKVEKAKAFEGGERSILVSSDGYVLDGHHQWLAKVPDNQAVKVIRLSAPMAELLPVAREFPSATVDTSSEETTPAVDTAQSAIDRLGQAQVAGMGQNAAPGREAGQPTTSNVAIAPAPGAPNGDTNGPAYVRSDNLRPGQATAAAPAVGVPGDQARAIATNVQDARLKLGEAVKLEPVTASESTDVALAQELSQALGRRFMAVRVTSGNTTMNAANVRGSDGSVTTVIREGAEDAAVPLAMHEALHGMDEDVKTQLHAALFDGEDAPVKAAHVAKFRKDYPNYAEDKVHEEIAALLTQQDAKRPEFWNQLRAKLGDGTFSKVAERVLVSLDKIVGAFRKSNNGKYTDNIEAVRAALTTAFAETARRKGSAPAQSEGMDFAEQGKKEQFGEHEGRSFKDGSIRIDGDADAVRAKLPDGVVGRQTKQGLVFTATDAARVRRALEGNNLAYSRAGAVLDKLPMRGGKYVGAPAKFDTPAKITHLRKWLNKLTAEGERGRFWYENSSREVLRMVGGDVTEARKFVALLAIYSPQAKVDANTTFALRAWAQYKAGQPISVKTGVIDTKAKEALDDVDAFWSGEKTGNFFHNLLREIDPTTEGQQGATIDMWMMRAGQYSNDAPTATQYAFMENETNRVADEMGWEPQQVQAAIWVAMKARMENDGVKKATEASSEKKGWIRFEKKIGEDGKAKKLRVIIDAQKHRDNWLKHAFEHEPTTEDTSKAKFDFSDGLLRHIGQISFEARPGRTSGVLPGIHDAPYVQQVEFQQAVQKAFYDDQGRDLLAHYLGLLVDGDITAPGVWQGEISPSTQKRVAMAPAKGDAGKTSVDPAQAQALNLYAAVAGLVARQEGVGWHRPFYAGSKAQANGLELDVGRPLNPREVVDLEKAIGKWMDANGKTDWQNQFAFISSPTGIRLVNFGIIENRQLHADIVNVAADVLPGGSMRQFASDGDMPTNDWKEHPDGQVYRQRISAAGRPDVLEWARAVLAPRVQRVFDDFSERYGWGDPGTIDFSEQRVGGREGGRGAADRTLQASERAADQEKLNALPGAPSVPGFSGPVQHLVATAEKYARSIGITLKRQSTYVEVDEDRARRIAAAYEAMPHAPNDQRVREAYENLIRQTTAQYQALVDAGNRFWFINLDEPASQEYASSPWNAMRDIADNKVMGVFPTEDGFGTSDFDPAANPLLADTGIKWPSGSLDGPMKRVLANDLFRAVHDAFGHGLEGAGFRARGEENAWQAHVRLFTGSAIGAITSETRGQNSWLNYGPHGASNQTAKVEDTVFADQKTGLMPEWTWSEGRVDFSEQTDSPEFKRWFGDSKVVDAEGKPLVVYHGTTANFDAFNQANIGDNFGLDKEGFFFTNNTIEASGYADPASQFLAAGMNDPRKQEPKAGANVMPVYLSLQNPLTLEVYTAAYYTNPKVEIDEQGISLIDYYDDNRESIVQLAKDGKHDGVLFRHRGKVLGVAFRPNQIKSATGNSGAFDGANADIRFSEQRRDDVSPLGLYSELARKIEGGPGQAMPDQWRAFIKGLTSKGVKQDEITWSGVEDWLEMQSGRKVPRAEVVAFLRADGVKVEETVLGAQAHIVDAAKSAIKANDDLGYDSTAQAMGALRRDFTRSNRGAADILDQYDMADGAERDAVQAWLNANDLDVDKSKYGQYTLPGGENYREVLLTLPAKAKTAPAGLRIESRDDYPGSPGGFNAYVGDRFVGWGETEEQARSSAISNATPYVPAYKSSHWDQSGILAHIRINDRTDVDGKRVLFVEELQSDWGQEGKKKGFFDAAKPFEVFSVYTGETVARFAERRAAASDAVARGNEFDYKDERSTKAPAAPFVTKTDAWLNLGLKRVIKMAVDGGYDKIAFVTGEQSADRYDLSKQVDQISYEPTAKGFVINVMAGGRNIKHGDFTTSELEDIVGKEIVKKMVAGEGEPEAAPDNPDYEDLKDIRNLRGDGLKVGGEGMKAFYDKIVPNAVRALAKKLGGEVTTVNMSADENAELDKWEPEDGPGDGSRAPVQQLAQPGLIITPAMRSAVEFGLPMFSDQRQVKTEDGEIEMGNARVRLAFPEEVARVEVIPVDGERVLRYTLMPGDGSFDALGHVDLLTEGGKPKSLLDVTVYRDAGKGRQNGIGRAAVEAVMAATDGDLNISNIVPEARGFWEALGVPAQNVEGAYDGTLNKQTYRPAAGRRAGQAAGGSRAADASQGRRADAGAEAQVPGSLGDIDFADQSTDHWILSRDELGRFRFGAGAKLYKAVADIANKVLGKVGMAPASKELTRYLRKMRQEVAKAQELTADVAGEMSKMSEAERLLLSDVIEKELAARIRPPKKILEMAASISAIMGRQSDELVRLGMLSQEAVDAWRDRYLPRFYESKLSKKFKDGWESAVRQLQGKPRAMTGIKGNSLHRRGMVKTIMAHELADWEAEGWKLDDKDFDPANDIYTTVHRDFTRAEREDMGEIRDAMFRFVMGYMASQKDIALGRMFEAMASDPKMSAKVPVAPDWVQVPETKVTDTKARVYGKLAGRWVAPETMANLSSFEKSEYDEILAIYKKALGMWKEGKTVLNPVSHVNNIMSNLSMAHFAGVSYWDTHKYVGTIRDLVKRAPIVKEAADAGLFGGTFNEQELLDGMPDQLKLLAAKADSKIERGINATWNALAFWLRKPMGAAYQNEDLFFRFLIYREARQRGLDVDDAVDYATKFIFEYGDLPKGARMIRDLPIGMPFFSYTYKAVPILAQTALEHPARMAAPFALVSAINMIAYAISSGDDDDDWMETLKRYATDSSLRKTVAEKEKLERDSLPVWMRGRTALGTQKTIRLGQDSVTGLPMFWDVSRFIPGGDMLDMENNAGGLDWPAPLTPSNPLLSTLGAMMWNKDTFLGKDVVNKDLDTNGEAAMKRGAWLWRQFAPAIAINSYHFNRGMAALATATGKEITWWPEDFTGFGKDGLPTQPSLAGLQTFGIKVRPVDLEMSDQISAGQRRKVISEIEAQIKQIRRLQNKQAISDDQADKRIEDQRTKIERLRDGLDINGNSKD